MPIQSSEIQWYGAAMVSDTVPAQNGGRPGAALVSGLKNGLFPDLTPAQRDAGNTCWRKAFCLARSSSETALGTPRVSLVAPTPGDGHALLYPATWTDTQATRSGRPYALALLAADASAGATSITVTTEADFSGMTDRPFQVGDLIRVDARSDLLAAGVSQTLAAQSVSYAGATVTIGFPTPGLADGYSAGARVASVLESADAASAVSGLTVSGGVTYPDDGRLWAPQIGAIVQTWTLTFTSAATGAFRIEGDTVGEVGTGATGADCAPANPDGGQYFVLPSDGWGGAPVTGDTLVFGTTPAGVPLWLCRVTPPGAQPIASDAILVGMEGLG